jgi:hypothetical protein
MAAVPDRRKLFTKKDSVAEVSYFIYLLFPSHLSDPLFALQFATDMDVNLLRDMKQLFQSMDTGA